MKRLVFIFILVFMSSLVLVAQDVRKVKSNAEMSFANLSHDYGSLEYGADGTYSFKFTNKAEKPIVITNVKSSCGCTIPSWPKEPIQPGSTGSITVKYNTKLSGSFNKTVQVFSTAENSPVKLAIRGKVNANPAAVKSSDKYNLQTNGKKIKGGQDSRSIQNASMEEEVEQGKQKSSSSRVEEYKKEFKEAKQKELLMKELTEKRKKK